MENREGIRSARKEIKNRKNQTGILTWGLLGPRTVTPPRGWMLCRETKGWGPKFQVEGSNITPSGNKKRGGSMRMVIGSVQVTKRKGSVKRIHDIREGGIRS